MNFDHQLFLTLNDALGDGWTGELLGMATHLGNGWVQAALCVPLMFFFSRTRFRSHLLAMALTAAAGGLFVAGAKVVVGRERPPTYFERQGVSIHTQSKKPPDNSFPSGHTQTAFSTATYLSLLYPALSPLFLLLAGLVGLSRISLGVHFPLDVLVGALLGVGFAIWGYRLNLRRLHKKEASST